MSTQQIAMPGSHDRILEIMKSEPTGLVLDAPAGTGALSNRLREIGFNVNCCDIDPGNFGFHDDIPFTCADFNQDAIDYPEDHFDYVICSNGLHRLFYPSNAISEFRRVLKPGGKLIIAWPNYTSLARRFKFLLTGSIGSSIDDASYLQTISPPASQVRFPLSMARVTNVAKQNSLIVRRVESVGYRFYDYLLAPLSLLASLTRSRFPDNRIEISSGGTTSIAIYEKLNRSEQ